MSLDPALLARAVALLQAGELVALPTETVYGLGADAANPAAVAKIFAVTSDWSAKPSFAFMFCQMFTQDFEALFRRRRARRTS